MKTNTTSSYRLLQFIAYMYKTYAFKIDLGHTLFLVEEGSSSVSNVAIMRMF